MEKWSFQRIRELMTHIALRGMAANELGRARISMMVRSISSNTRPDTLVQDRTLQPHRFLLQRTAGPYMWVTGRKPHRQNRLSALFPISERWLEHISRLCPDIRASLTHSRAPSVKVALSRCYGASGEGMAPSALLNGYRWSAPCRKLLTRAGPSPPSSRITH